jgi:hypothetical protein
MPLLTVSTYIFISNILVTASNLTRYFSLICTILSIEIRQHFVASKSEDAFDAIAKTKKKLAALSCELALDDLESQRNLTLIIEMLNLREPFHGRKYFKVLIMSFNVNKH